MIINKENHCANSKTPSFTRHVNKEQLMDFMRSGKEGDLSFSRKKSSLNSVVIRIYIPIQDKKHQSYLK